MSIIKNSIILSAGELAVIANECIAGFGNNKKSNEVDKSDKSVSPIQCKELLLKREKLFIC